jgi:hypothetical protein
MIVMKKSVAGTALALLLVNCTALAAEQPYTGTFNGHGKDCDGTLVVRAKTIEWTASPAMCKNVGYKIIKKEIGKDRIDVSFRLKKSAGCDFAAMELNYDSTYPAYWAFSGYTSVDDLKKGNDGSLNCSVEKAGK